MSLDKFGFPFTPYTVQIDFMNHLIEVLGDGKIGIFESPTGTGKSMSLLCGALTWLRNHQKEIREDLETKANLQPKVSATDDWMSEQTQFKELQDEAAHAKKLLLKLDQQVKKRQDYRNHWRKRKRDDDDDDEHELRELLKTIKKNVQGANEDDEDTDDDLLVDYRSDEEDAQDDEEENNMTRIYYCSRTHSQLAQFVQEVKRSAFGSEIRLVSLASRQNLCVNEAVLKLQNMSLINERCLDMQKNKTSSKSKNSCSFKREVAIENLSEGILADVQDVEELARNGRATKSCPYYATRLAVPEAELVVLPYNTLLHSGTRSASGLNLKDSVVIIDEAHNLMETIVSVHTVSLGGQQINKAHDQLNQYFSRYKKRLTAQNLLYVKQLLFVLGAFQKYLLIDFTEAVTAKQGSCVRESVQSPIDFMTETGVDNINLFKLVNYCDKSRISRKLHGFTTRSGVNVSKKPVQSKLTSYLQNLNGTNTGNEENEEPVKEGSQFVNIQEFLRSLTTASKDGRVISKRSADVNVAGLKFLLLNPAAHFQTIVSDARAIILAGGTMHPHSEFIDRLLTPSGVKSDRISQFSCGHVVPQENLLALTLSKGPGGREFNFTYGSRGNAELIEDAGRFILNLSVLVPGGMVVFFPSYEYEQFVYSLWEKSGLLLRLSGRKRVFREPRKSSQVESVLANYAKSAAASNTKGSQQNGAILLSIVGGKMSEGINFSDDLGRCVVMVGLPFPNVHSLEFKEKVSYLDGQLGSGAGSSYGQILCMRAVNQSIGRAIRHHGDYATIVLMDLRYQKPTVQSGLPEWIRNSLQNTDNVGLALASVKKFFALHKSNAGP